MTFITLATVFKRNVWALYLANSNTEEASKFEKKLLENEVCVYLQLACVCQLVKQISVRFRVEEHVAVVVPYEVHVLSDVFL